MSACDIMKYVFDLALFPGIQLLKSLEIPQ